MYSNFGQFFQSASCLGTHFQGAHTQDFAMIQKLNSRAQIASHELIGLGCVVFYQ